MQLFSKIENSKDIIDKEYVDQLLDKKANVSGQAFTGGISAPNISTGSAAANYFQSQKFRGEGNADTYYHAVDFGYAGHNQVDFHEYGGVYNFYQNTAGTASGGTLIGAITSSGIKEGSTLLKDKYAQKSELATVATSGSYNDLSNKPTIPPAITSIDGLGGGTLTSPMTLTGGDSATASKMILSTNGQITDSSTSTMLGFSGGNYIVGSSNYPTTLRGKQTRPTWNGQDLALKSDVPTIPTDYVKYTTQTLTDAQKSTARSNIGAGTSNFSGNYNDLSNKPTIPTVNNGTLTIQKNGTDVQTFTANQSTNATANITVPETFDDLVRIKKQGYAGNNNAVQYFKLATFPEYNSSGNYASLIITGRMGGWEAGNMSFVNMIVYNRGAEGGGYVSVDNGNFSSLCDIVMYRETNNYSTVYIKVSGYYTFDININTFQSTYAYTGSNVTPTGTLKWTASSQADRLVVSDGVAYVNGHTLPKTIQINGNAANPNAAGLVDLGTNFAKLDAENTFTQNNTFKSVTVGASQDGGGGLNVIQGDYATGDYLFTVDINGIDLDPDGHQIPLLLQGDTGISGQVLTTQGTNKTPYWGFVNKHDYTQLTNENLNTITEPGWYRAAANNTCTNRPSPIGVNAFILVVEKGGDANIKQTLYRVADDVVYSRYTIGTGGSWLVWRTQRLVFDAYEQTFSGRKTFSSGINLTASLQVGGSAGTAGQVLTSTGTGTPQWTTLSSSNVITGNPEVNGASYTVFDSGEFGSFIGVFNTEVPSTGFQITVGSIVYTITSPIEQGVTYRLTIDRGEYNIYSTIAVSGGTVNKNSDFGQLSLNTAVSISTNLDSSYVESNTCVIIRG